MRTHMYTCLMLFCFMIEYNFKIHVDTSHIFYGKKNNNIIMINTPHKNNYSY